MAKLMSGNKQPWWWLFTAGIWGIVVLRHVIPSFSLERGEHKHYNRQRPFTKFLSCLQIQHNLIANYRPSQIGCFNNCVGLLFMLHQSLYGYHLNCCVHKITVCTFVAVAYYYTSFLYFVKWRFPIWIIT